MKNMHIKNQNLLKKEKEFTNILNLMPEGMGIIDENN